jgi:hypothetical protein
MMCKPKGRTNDPLKHKVKPKPGSKISVRIDAPQMRAKLNEQEDLTPFLRLYSLRQNYNDQLTGVRQYKGNSEGRKFYQLSFV